MTPECRCPWYCFRHVWQAWGAGGAGKGLGAANGVDVGPSATGLVFERQIANSAGMFERRGLIK